MAGVQEELWNIFTFYALRSSPSDFTRVSVSDAFSIRLRAVEISAVMEKISSHPKIFFVDVFDEGSASCDKNPFVNPQHLHCAIGFETD